MRLVSSEEQERLKEGARRFLQEARDRQEWRATADGPLGYDDAIWRRMADLGWLGLRLPEEYGGVAGSSLDLMALMEAFGAGLVLEPYVSTAVVGASIIEQAGTSAQKQDWLTAIISGHLRFSLAYLERDSQYDIEKIATIAEPAPKCRNYELRGVKTMAVDAPFADKLIVSARIGKANPDVSGLALFVVDRAAPGVEVRPVRMVDRRRAADVVLKKVIVGEDAMIVGQKEGAKLLRRTIDTAEAALMAEAVGIMDHLLLVTRDYLATRQQFGVTLATLQVLQHRLVDMRVAAEEGRTAAQIAALAIERDDPSCDVSAAKVKLAECARFVASQAVQLHGAIGMTDELDVGDYLKRLEVINRLHGDSAFHLERYRLQAFQATKQG